MARSSPARRLPVLSLALACTLALTYVAPGGFGALAQAGNAPAAQKPDATRFTAVTVVPPGELDEPLTFAVAKDGRVFINERRTGHIKMYDPVTKTTQIVASIPSNHQYTNASGAQREAEEGFVGLVLDPNFLQNGFVYVLYADINVRKHVLARIQLRDETSPDGARTMRAVPGSHRTLLEYETQREECCHTGGGMVFDNAGNLLITVGNNRANSPGSQTDERIGRSAWDDQGGAANTNDLRGKILRIHPEPDGTYTIPAGNLFPPGTPNTRPEIFSMGHRNPWRVSIDSKTGWVYWGEVGPDNQVDDPYIGPRGYDEFNQAKGPGFFGWPYFVGNNAAFPFRDYVRDRIYPPKDPKRPTNTSPNNTGLKELPPAQPAIIYYPSGISEEFPEVGAGGRCATGGPVYRRSDFATDARRPWPAYYEGKWLATECSRGWIMAITLNDRGEYVSMERFMPNVPFAEPMDIKFGPDGDLYVLDYGNTWFAKSDDSKLVRFEYEAGNRAPKAVASADRTGGTVPFQVTLSSAGTVDYDGDALQYAWSVETADGRAPRTFRGESPRVSIDRNGTYVATLTVTDAAGAKSTDSVDIIAGNEPPGISIDVQSSNRTFYRPGSPLTYSVRVTDKEDGTVPAEQVAFSVNYVPDTLDPALVSIGQSRVDATTRFGVAKALVAQSDCLTCHNRTNRSRGPSMTELAARYANADEATINTLVGKVRSGGTGVWGPEVMPAHPLMSPGEARAIVQYFLAINDKRIASAPLQGSFQIPASDVDTGRGSVVFHAAYTDKGNGDVPWQTAEAVAVRRSPRIDPARADVKSNNIELVTGRNQSGGVIPKANSHIGFRQIDMTGVRRLDVATGGGGRGGGVGGSIEVRVGSPAGELIGQSTVGAAVETTPAPAGAATTAPAQVTIPAEGMPAPATGGRGGGAGAIAAANAQGFPPATSPEAVAAAMPIGRGGGAAGTAVTAARGAGAGAAAGTPGGGRGAAPAGGRGAVPPAGGAGGGGRGNVAPAAVAIELKPQTGMRDVYLVFKNERASPAERLMTISTVTFAQ